jgi:hypothetical protein
MAYSQIPVNVLVLKVCKVIDVVQGTIFFFFKDLIWKLF